MQTGRKKSVVRCNVFQTWLRTNSDPEVDLNEKLALKNRNIFVRDRKSKRRGDREMLRTKRHFFVDVF